MGGHWLNDLSGNKRAAVDAVLGQLRIGSDWFLAEHQRLTPGSALVATTGVHMGPLFSHTALQRLLQEVGAGAAPEVAGFAASVEAEDEVRKWNKSPVADYRGPYSTRCCDPLIDDAVRSLRRAGETS